MMCWFIELCWVGQDLLHFLSGNRNSLSHESTVSVGPALNCRLRRRTNLLELLFLPFDHAWSDVWIILLVHLRKVFKLTWARGSDCIQVIEIGVFLGIPWAEAVVHVVAITGCKHHRVLLLNFACYKSTMEVSESFFRFQLILQCFIFVLILRFQHIFAEVQASLLLYFRFESSSKLSRRLKRSSCWSPCRVISLLSHLVENSLNLSKILI